MSSPLAHLAERHGLVPEGTARYVNPANGATKEVAFYLRVYNDGNVAAASP